MAISIVTASLVLAASAASHGQDVTVREHAGVYHVTASFPVPQALETALAVLTDYEHIPRFMPDVRESVVRERSGQRVVVEQEAVSRMLMFSKRVHLLLEIEESSQSLQFRDRCGRSFIRYEGAWRFEESDGQTMIQYELTAQPAFSWPDFLVSRLLKRDAQQMIQRLRTEIATRARPPERQ